MKTFNKNLSTAFLAILFLLSGTAFSQSDDYLEYGAYLKRSKTLWKEVVSKKQSKYKTTGKSEDLFDLVLAQHGLLNATMADQDEEMFDTFLDDAKNNLRILIKNKHQEADSKAILSNIYGLEMGYSSWKGIYLGGKSSSLINQAMKLDPSSPIVWQVYAGSKLFTPEMFGGDPEEAVTAYEKSISLFESGKNTNSWRYLDALVWLGQSYVKTGKQEKAIAIYEKALEVEPEFVWVKNELLPNLIKQQ